MKFPTRMCRFSEMTAAASFSPAMRIRICPIALAVLVLLRLQAFAGIAEQSQLLQARTLSNQGEFAQTIRILEPLVHSDPAALDDASRGGAWNLLGLAHMFLGGSNEARHCYENAIHLVRRLPAASSTYASTLANLGTLETSLHQLKPPKLRCARPRDSMQRPATMRVWKGFTVPRDTRDRSGQHACGPTFPGGGI